MQPSITIGTRGSQLALWQAQWVKTALQQHHPSLTVDLEIIKTKGDKILDVPLAQVGGKGLFVKEIEQALLDGHVDLAVHSMKDMPAQIPEGLCIGAVPTRETTSDVLISRTGASLKELRTNARIGTSSLRRAAQLKHFRPDIEVVPLRGNLDTRIRKLETENLDAIVLAAAGVKRLGFEKRISEYIDPSIMLPAIGQGALCIESRSNDPAIDALLSPLNDIHAKKIVLCERAFLEHLEGNCQVPIAALGTIHQQGLSLCGLVADLDGSTIIKDELRGPIASYRQIGTDLAERLLKRGGSEILKKLFAMESQ